MGGGENAARELKRVNLIVVARSHGTTCCGATVALTSPVAEFTSPTKPKMPASGPWMAMVLSALGLDVLGKQQIDTVVGSSRAQLGWNVTVMVVSAP